MFIFICLLLFYYVGCNELITQNAPGQLYIDITSIGPIDGCFTIEDRCKYEINVCIGDGLSWIMKCLRTGNRTYTGSLAFKLDPTPQIKVELDNIHNKLKLFANVTITRDSNEQVLKRIKFERQSVSFDSRDIPTQIEAYSQENFISMSMSVTVECTQGFYPINNCSIKCFPQPPRYHCDSNGTKICNKGYKWSQKRKDCLKDYCRELPNYCKNNSTCVSEDRIKCRCPLHYIGLDCGTWKPCANHKCQNEAICQAKSTGYICHCKKPNTYGTFCEKIDQSRIRVLSSCFCNKKEICVENKCVSKDQIKKKEMILETSSKKSTELSTTKSTKKPDDINRNSIRLVQTQFQNTYTILVTSFVVLVFMVGIFVVSYWVLKLKYFRKKDQFSTLHSYPTLPPLPNMMPTYRGGGTMNSEDNFRRCHSLDDSSIFLYGTSNQLGSIDNTLVQSHFVDSLPRQHFHPIATGASSSFMYPTQWPRLQPPPGGLEDHHIPEATLLASFQPDMTLSEIPTTHDEMATNHE